MNPRKRSATGSPASTTGTGLPFGIRAIQLDLARHMETVDHIRRYTDFAAARGFNALFLYLEGRVRTRTFPFRPADTSYSREDMAKIVAHARQAGMEVIPALATLGHTEQFVSCKEMARYAEERDGRTRFGGKSAYTLCTSLDETYTFLEDYIGELTEVFPGTNVHVGLDESWNTGFCDLCRARLEKDGLGSIFTAHVTRLDAILHRLGKRLWMWDDMYELFPDALEHTPKRAVMTHWNYGADIELEGCSAHFVNRWRQDWLAVYERLGLDAVIAPWSRYPRNVDVFTDYGRRHNVLGGLLTQWEGTQRVQPDNFTIVTFTGNLWSGKTFDPQAAWDKAVDATVPGASPALKAGVSQLFRLPWNYAPADPKRYLMGPISASEHTLLSLLDAVQTLLTVGRQEAKLSPKTWDMLDLADWSLRIRRVGLELRDLLPRIYSPKRLATDLPGLKKRATAAKQELKTLLANLSAWYERHQDDAHPDDARFFSYWEKQIKGLETAWQRLNQAPTAHDWWLVLRLFLQDYYGSPRLKVTLLTAGSETVVADASFKAVDMSTAGQSGGFYTVYLPFTADQAPEAVRLEGWSYGGQGVVYVEAQNPQVTLHPYGLLRVEGEVERAEAVLRDDSAYTYLGCRDITAEMHRAAVAERRAIIEIGLLER